jgi:hypothetical protein
VSKMVARWHLVPRDDRHCEADPRARSNAR